MTSSQLPNYLSVENSTGMVLYVLPSQVCKDKSEMINRTKNIGLEMLNIWACHSEGGICQTVWGKLVRWWIVKHQFIPSSNILMLNQQDVINVSKCLIHIIITVCSCSDSFWAYCLSCSQHTRPSPPQLRHSENPWQLIYQGRYSQQHPSSFFNAQDKYFN